MAHIKRSAKHPEQGYWDARKRADKAESESPESLASEARIEAAARKPMSRDVKYANDMASGRGAEHRSKREMFAHSPVSAE